MLHFAPFAQLCGVMFGGLVKENPKLMSGQISFQAGTPGFVEEFKKSSQV
jgi:hypothetical protein